MARGDVVNQIDASVGAGSRVTYQPSSGVEVMFTAAGLSGSNVLINEAGIGVYNGTTESFIHANPPGESTVQGPAEQLNMKIFVNNSIYFMVRNDDGATRHTFMTGVTTK